MARRNYSDWSQKQLIEELIKLKKRKKYGLVWDEERAKEKFDEEVEGKLPLLHEETNKNIFNSNGEIYNVLIEGDNYHTLSVLNYTHFNKIDTIYIDPPYNTGNKDFYYNDSYINTEDAYRHSKWLSFMSKRLHLAKKLLKSTGLFFISIDINELAQLKLLCDEVFGEKNIVSLITVKVKDPAGVGQQSLIFDVSEYILVYAKNINKVKSIISVLPTELEEIKDKGNNYGKIVTEFGKGIFIKELDRKNVGKVKVYRCEDYTVEKTNELSLGDYIKNRKYIFADYNPNGGMILAIKDEIPRTGLSYIEYVPSKGRDMGKLTKTYFYNGRIISWLENVTEYSKGKLYKRVKMTNVWNVPNASLYLEGGVDFTNGKKSLKMMKKILSIGGNKDALVLDYFAGSGTTGQAVLEMNAEDQGKRQFILATNDDEGICTEICYPRLKNVMLGENQQAKLGGNLRYYSTCFLSGVNTDKNKLALVSQSTEMLCLKEECHDLVEEKKHFKLFKNKNKYLGIIYDDEGIEEFKKEIKELGRKVNTYVFSLDDSAREEEFEDIIDLVELKPIPEVILNVYRGIFK